METKPRKYATCRRCDGGRWDPEHLHELCQRCNGTAQDPENIAADVDALCAGIDPPARRYARVIPFELREGRQRGRQETPSNDMPSPATARARAYRLLVVAVAFGMLVGFILGQLAGCAPVPPATAPLGDEPAIDGLPVELAAPWTPGRPIHMLLFGPEPGVYHAYANDDTLPFAWGYLPAPPARHALDPTLRELNDERLWRARITHIHVEQLRGSDFHGLELHAMTGVTVGTPVTITVRRTR